MRVSFGGHFVVVVVGAAFFTWRWGRYWSRGTAHDGCVCVYVYGMSVGCSVSVTCAVRPLLGESREGVLLVMAALRPLALACAYVCVYIEFVSVIKSICMHIIREVM